MEWLPLWEGPRDGNSGGLGALRAGQHRNEGAAVNQVMAPGQCHSYCVMCSS